MWLLRLSTILIGLKNIIIIIRIIIIIIIACIDDVIVFEHCILEQYQSFLYNNNQYGFKKGVSCNL